MDARMIAGLYAQGLFPMDEPGAPELPWWVADPRTIFELDADARAALRRRVRRSLRATAGCELRLDRAFDAVVVACGRPRHRDDGVWLTPRLHERYRVLRAAGYAHTFELWSGDMLAAGIVAVTIGRAAMLESMFHRLPDAGNALLSRTLDALAARGCELCDVQTSTPHTLRLGAVELSRADYEARLLRALR